MVGCGINHDDLSVRTFSIWKEKKKKHKTNTLNGAKHAACADFFFFFLNKQRSSPAAVTLNKEREWIARLAVSTNIIKEVTSQKLMQREERSKSE